MNVARLPFASTPRGREGSLSDSPFGESGSVRFKASFRSVQPWMKTHESRSLSSAQWIRLSIRVIRTMTTHRPVWAVWYCLE